MKHLKSFKQINEGRVAKADRIEILRDSKYIIVAPLTHKASCKYGAFTGWCTAAPENDDIWDSVTPNLNKPNYGKLVYVLQKKYKQTPEQIKKHDEFRELYDLKENGDDYDENRFMELEYDFDSYYYEKIAIEYNCNNGSYTIWDMFNIPMVGANIWGLPIDEYVIDKIVEFCRN